MKVNYFKQRREELGLTQRDIALKLGMTTTAVSLWENGDSLPRITLFYRLADVYQVSVERISAEVLKLARLQPA